MVNSVLSFHHEGAKGAKNSAEKGVQSEVRVKFLGVTVQVCVNSPAVRLLKFVFRTEGIQIAVIVFVEFVAFFAGHEFHELTRIKFSTVSERVKYAAQNETICSFPTR